VVQGHQWTVMPVLCPAGCSATLLFFAPPHSLVPILGDLARVLGESRPCVIARELTKVDFHSSPPPPKSMYVES